MPTARIVDVYGELAAARRDLARLGPIERECAALRESNDTLRRELARAAEGRAGGIEWIRAEIRRLADAAVDEPDPLRKRRRRTETDAAVTVYCRTVQARHRARGGDGEDGEGRT